MIAQGYGRTGDGTRAANSMGTWILRGSGTRSRRHRGTGGMFVPCRAPELVGDPGGQPRSWDSQLMGGYGGRGHGTAPACPWGVGFARGPGE